MIEVADWYIEMGGFARFMFNLGIATFVLVGCAVSWFIVGWLIVKWEDRHRG